MHSIRKVVFSSLVVGVLMAGASADAVAVAFEQKLFPEIASEDASVRITTITLANKLNKKLRMVFPPEAMGEKDYERLSIEVRKLSRRLDEVGGDYNLALRDPEWIRQVDHLVERIIALSDERKTGRCVGLELDMGAAEQSQGDWTVARKPDGSAIKPSGGAHYGLFRYFRWGCGGKKDLVAARKVLFDISDTAFRDPPSMRELKPTIRHCTAEMWARYGVGGPIDKVRADEFSRRFTAEAWFPNQSDTPEARAALAARYPDMAAKENFKCPAMDDSFRIDPSDPWKDLW